MSNDNQAFNQDATRSLPPPHRARSSLWVYILGLTGLVVWAYYGKIDQVTRAQAQVIAQEFRAQCLQLPLPTLSG